MIGHAWFFFGISMLRKHGSPCLLRSFLAYIFSGLLITMQFVKRVCGKIVSSYAKHSVYRAEIKGSEIVRKKWFSKELYRDQLKVSDKKMLLLTEKIEKAYLVPNYFVCLNDDIVASFSSWECMLITFFRSEVSMILPHINQHINLQCKSLPVQCREYENAY